MPSRQEFSITLPLGGRTSTDPDVDGYPMFEDEHQTQSAKP
jgi:hypothetical protein